MEPPNNESIGTTNVFIIWRFFIERYKYIEEHTIVYTYRKLPIVEFQFYNHYNKNIVDYYRSLPMLEFQFHSHVHTFWSRGEPTEEEEEEEEEVRGEGERE